MPSWYLSVDRQVTGIDPASIYWRALSESNTQLTAIAKSLGVEPILAFYSMPASELSEFLPKGSKVEEEKWFPATAGLETASNLLAHLRNSPNVLANQEEVTSELQEFEQLLRRFESEGIGFHIAIDF